MIGMASDQQFQENSQNGPAIENKVAWTIPISQRNIMHNKIVKCQKIVVYAES